MPSNDLAILEEFEQRFQRLERMLIDTNVPERLAAVEQALHQYGDPVGPSEPAAAVDPHCLGISVEGEDIEMHTMPGSDSTVMKTTTDGTATSHLRTFFSQHTATSLVKQRHSATQQLTENGCLLPPEHYRFVESTWDLMMFVGTGHLGLLGSLQTVCLVLLTVLMQLVFVGIAVNNFLDPVVSDETVSDALRWRRTSAHAFWEYDSVLGKSLGERVCGGDKSLHLSGIQMSLYEEIRNYLRTDAEGLSAFFNGQSLCIVALLCWYMMVAKEISQALALHRGMVAIATGVTDIEARENPFTQIMHFKLNLVSSTRKILSYVLLIYRLLAAAMLVYVGSFFLVFTVNVTELILNAVSLGIILDIDNYIFQAMASAAGRDLMNYLEPLCVPSYRRFGGSDVKSCCMCLAVPALTLWVLFSMLLPMSDTLHQVDRAMCGGRLDFVWAFDERHITILAPTNSSQVREYGKVDAIDQAGGYSSGPHTEYAVWVEDAFKLGYLFQLQLNDQINAWNPKCVDLASNETMLNYLRDGVGNWSINSCAEVIPYCKSVTSMPAWGLDGGKGLVTRMLCSETCGCADPGGEFLYVQGCPYDSKQCLSSESYLSKLAEADCVEKTASELRNFTPWVSWVEALRHFANVTGMAHRNRMQAKVLADHMWEYGCDFKFHMTSSNISWGDCFQWGPLFDWGFKTLAFYCPITCGCTSITVTNQDSRCPLPAGGCLERPSSGPSSGSGSGSGSGGPSGSGSSTGDGTPSGSGEGRPARGSASPR